MCAQGKVAALVAAVSPASGGDGCSPSGRCRPAWARGDTAWFPGAGLPTAWFPGAGLPATTLLLLDEPTGNLDLPSADALQRGLEAYQGTVLAVTPDRWSARSFDRFLVSGSDGTVRESPNPVRD
jgi:hypothetical protein